MADEITSGASMLAAGAVDGNFLTRLRDIEQRISVLEGANMQAAALDEISSDMGDMRSGRFIAASEGFEPTESDFVGSFVSAYGEDFTATGGGTIHVGSAKGGTVSAGFNTDGDLVAMLGKMRINENGTYFTLSGEDLSSGIVFQDGAGVSSGIGASIASFQFSGDNSASGGTMLTQLTANAFVPIIQLYCKYYDAPIYSLLRQTQNGFVFSQYNSTPPDYLGGFGTITFSGGTITAERFVGAFDLSGTLNGSVNGGTVGASSAIITGAFTAGTITAQAQGGTPTAPGAGYRTLYPKTDGWYDLNSGGTVARLAYASEIVAAAYPKCAEVSGYAMRWYNSGGTELPLAFSTDFLVLRQSTTGDANNGDYAQFGTYLADGTYTLRFRYSKSNAGCKVDIYVDSTKITSTPIDQYAASSASASTDTDFTIATGGYHVVKFLVNGKNASSADYYLYIGLVSIVASTY